MKLSGKLYQFTRTLFLQSLFYCYAFRYYTSIMFLRSMIIKINVMIMFFFQLGNKKLISLNGYSNNK